MTTLTGADKMGFTRRVTNRDTFLGGNEIIGKKNPELLPDDPGMKARSSPSARPLPADPQIAAPEIHTLLW